MPNLFGIKTVEEKAREQRVAQARAVSHLDSAIKKMTAENLNLQKECDKYWEEAKSAMLSGNVSARNSALNGYKFAKNLRDKQAMRLHFARTKKMELSSATMLGDALSAIVDIAKSANINVEEILKQVDAVNDISIETNLSMDAIDKSIADEQEAISSSDSSVVGVDSDLLSALEEEVLGVTGIPNSNSRVENTKENLGGEINNNLNEINNMLSSNLK